MKDKPYPQSDKEVSTYFSVVRTARIQRCQFEEQRSPYRVVYGKVRGPHNH